MKKPDILVICLLFLLAFLIRLWFVSGNNISFHYDMSRDATAAEEIWQLHHLKILGPPTSTPGLFHGVLYYYLIAIFYLFGQGDPFVSAIGMSLLNSLALIPIFILAKSYFKSLKWGILAGILYAISFEAIQYAGWLSNPSPAILTVSTYFLGLYLWMQGKRGGLLLAVVVTALSIQFQFFLLYLLVGIIIFKYVFKLPVSFKDIYLAILILIVGLSSFIVSAVRFNNISQILTGFSTISSTSHFTFDEGWSPGFINYLNHLTNIYINNFSPSNVFLGGILALVSIYICRKEKFIVFGILLNSILFIFGGHSSNYVSVGIVVPAILSLIYLLKNLSPRLAALIIIGVLFSNLYTIIKLSTSGQTALIIPKTMILKSQLTLIDKSYEVAKYKPFSINSITLPFWTNTTWGYLYHWYGLKKYGYVPTFYGRDQIGQPGNDYLKKVNQPEEISFLILEPADGIPTSFYQDEINYENSRTKLIQRLDFKGLILEFRHPIIPQ